ncbi:uncharacterized protein LOC110692006 isoform X2 [Chenopodium quinoa]|uniref:uncharacterized protein LOC110692006 isoform X2 n=1 Tax=Chenopodium quinoa TaxID=63459 RepID=UPI000B7903D1|nr:uncharacterized protein LOC110692006 isoform X2 [Chenopodium quinoa]
MDSSDSIFLEDFGQKVDLTRRIREVLVNYPEGTTVLKELVQNADDAGATKVCLCLDRRSHGGESLLSNSLAQWQGPALLAYNDAAFTEDDFVSISRIGGSTKHSQAWKTGRFGVGFNSVYHLTDLPSFVSGKYVVLFDPQGVYLPNVSASNPGKRIEYVSSSALSHYKDQFFPYCAFGCNMKSTFNGTLFRFPLRNAEQAAESKLSRQAYSEDDISSMFTQLYEEGVFSLLFLKSVLSIEMYVWDVGETVPRKLYSCSVSSADEDIISHRQLLLRLSKLSSISTFEMDSFKLDFVTEAVSGSSIQKRTDTFYIVQAMASSSSRIGSFAAKASREYDIHLLPWASIAACISDDPIDGDGLKVGRAFCFLPLPVRTGLTVQVNGYFEVSSNRRGIWYGEDMDRSGKIRSIWNRLLLEDVIAPIFRSLLLGVQGMLGPTSSYYSLWPTGDFEEPWSILIQQVYKNIVQAPVFYSDVGGGKWVSPTESFLHDEEYTDKEELADVLLQLGKHIVRLPNPVRNMLLKYTTDFQWKVITPDTVRCFIRDCGSVSNLGSAQRLLLLEYCLEDILDSDVGKYVNNLPLLPLANGSFGSFSEASQGISYFICNELEHKLLQQIPDRIVDGNIPKKIMERLSAVADCSGANVLVFKAEYLVQLLHKFMPPEWRLKGKVLWDHERGQNNHPTPLWFVIFWQYLRLQCENLSLFHEWPILPSTSGHLYRFSKQSKLIIVEKLSERLRCVLEKVGCKILDPQYEVEHPDLSYYICEATGPAVLESIFDVVSSSGGVMHTCLHVLEAEERNELRNFILDPKWYIGGYMGDSDKWKCKKLPIFRVYGEESDDSFHFADLVDSQRYLPPKGVSNCFLGSEFIFTSSDVEENVLQRYYGLQRMGKAHFYRRQVFCRIKDLPAEDRDHIMLSILKDLPHLCIEDSGFKEAVRNIEFVPTHTGSTKCPGALYDPRNEELLDLLEDTDLFPCGSFQESDILDILQGLGLKTSASPDTVIQCARYIEKIKQEDLDKAYLKGKNLLAYLEVNAHRWAAIPLNDDHRTLNRVFSRAAIALRPRNLKSDLEKFWNDLRMICWCPVIVTAPYQALPWPGVSSTVAPPKLVRPKTDLWLVSASMRILDGECASTILSYQLGWSSPPVGSVVAAQILELGKDNEIVTDQAFRQQLALAMPRIYARLTDMIGSDEMDIIKVVLEGSRWIWVGDGFATAEEVVLNGPLHLAPYIRVIPIDLAVFKELFLVLGVREFLNLNDYAMILCRMATRKGEEPLTGEELTAAILVVQHLAEAPFHEKHVMIYLPDASCRLLPASDLVYNDAPWLLGSEDLDSPSSHANSLLMSARRSVQKFVHGNISNDVAEKLGVCSLRRSLLAESADSMNLSLSGAAEAFGQHEALTTRLKHILEMYADGPGILFELVQNAEDAGASEVIFLLDKTQYKTSSLLSPEMADWQGPALYCYNDSIFSPQDLYSISRIGQDSKLEKPFAIGRFGLGFNSVYHFTDIPSFVSGENIVMFDPHACNLPGISPSHPGLRIKFVGRRILEQFPDQFTPFLHFGCDLQNQFPGTLFRFPLRTASTAPRSQIKQEGYEPEDVASLFSSFSKIVSETLLFLRRVKSISLFVKDGSNSELQLVHRVQRHTVLEPEHPPHALQHMFDYLNGIQLCKVDKNQLLDKLRGYGDENLPRRLQKVVVREQSSSDDVSHVWMMSECLGSGLDKNSAVTKLRSHKGIPWAAVAAYLQSTKVDAESCDSTPDDRSLANLSSTSQDVELSAQYRKNFEGRAFCFLPLPISTGLPAHVNAYFELSSNRRDIWFGNDMSGGGRTRSDWNIYLLEHVAAPAYAHLLEKLAMEVGSNDWFLSFWPTKLGGEPWSSVVQKLYMFIADFDVRVLHTQARGGQWISAKQGLFPDFTFEKMPQLADALSDVGLPLVTVSQALVDRFVEVRPSLHFLTPQLLRMLLIRRKCKFTERSALNLTLQYCLFDLEKPIQSNCLYGLPLIPLSNGSSTTFNPRGVDERIYIAHDNEYDLLKDSIPNQLVDKAIPEEVYLKLCDIAQNEDSNVSFLTCHLLEKLFLRILPVDWQNAKQVKWAPGHAQQPSLEWMRLLWSYLRSSCDDLSVFSKWPVLPVGTDLLMQLVKNSNIIEDEGWSEIISSLLLKVGCLFLRRDFAIEHPLLKNYVQAPTASGILNAFLAVAGSIENVDRLFADSSERELHELRNFILQSKWFVEGEMHDINIEVIKRVPMFESCRSRKLVSLSRGIKWLKPSGLREELIDDDFVRSESEGERIILNRYLDVQELSKADFYKNYVLNHMPDFHSSQGALSAILHEVKVLIVEDVSIKDALSNTPFVLSCNGSWKQPSRLYDPRVPDLHLLLHKEVFFPAKEFSDPETLDMLSGLGMKQSLDYTGLLDCARTVSLLNDSRDSETCTLGRRLLACLDALGSKLSIEDGEESSKLFEEEFHSMIYKDDCDVAAFLGSFVDAKPPEEFWSELKSIYWCPIYVNPPLHGLPWLKSSDLAEAPTMVRPKSDMWMVSSTMHVLDADCYSTFVKSKLGWMDRPSVQALSTQLVELSKSYCQLKLDSVVDPTFDAELQKGITLLYSIMQEYIHTEDFMILKSSLEGISWVWIGDGFVAPNDLAFDSPVKFQPYLYVVPSELSSFRDLLLAMGVKLDFEVTDYFRALDKLQTDIKGSALSDDQLFFVHCVLEAVADCFSDMPPSEVSSSHLLIPDASGILTYSKDLVFNDAPWMENNISIGKKFVHPRISNDLALMLGVQSLRCMSLVDEEMAKDLVCMDFARISELLTLYASHEFLLFDLLELADSCNTKKMHIIFDKREHPCQSLLQHNLGEFQGPALLVIFEGAGLSREEVTSLQFLPPWRLRGDTLNYGLGLLSSFSVCDLLSVMSGGYYYIFDPRGLVLAPSSGHSPGAKVFSLAGTNLTERFRDQFSPMLGGQNMMFSSDMTIIRVPLSSEFMTEEPEAGFHKIKQIYDSFVEHGSRVLLSLKSVLQVSLSRWEEGNLQPSEDYSVCIDSSSARLRNPFSEKKWRKFQISRLFSSSNSASKMHVIDITCRQGENKVSDQWVTALSMGSGQTRNMALDRRYLAYNLTPVAGVAVHVSRNGHPADLSHSSCVMSPLPLSAKIDIPVTILGYFLVRHNRGRYLFKVQEGYEVQPDAGSQLIEAWNKELMACIRDSYIEITMVMQKMRRGSADEPSAEHAVDLALKKFSDHLYSLWPRSDMHSQNDQPGGDNFVSVKVPKADWECIVERVIRPFYVRLADLPVWPLYSGNLVRVEEGMFLSQPGNGVGESLLPATVCNFVKEHYPVFSVPWYLISELQLVGVTVREIKPKMVRDLLRVSSTSMVVRSVETFVDVLEYCLSDIHLPESSGSSEGDISVDFNSFPQANRLVDGSSTSLASIRGLHGVSTHSPTSSGADALEMMSSLGKALFDFGRGVVEDIGKTGNPTAQRDRITNVNSFNVAHGGNKFLSIAAELRGLPCPTAANNLARLGITDLWVGNNDQQMLLRPLLGKFIHLKILERPTLADIFFDVSLQSLLKLHKLSLHLLANHMRLLFHESWVKHVMNSNMAPWFSWDNCTDSGGEAGPSPDWIRLFWKNFDGSSDDLSLFSDWPLIPAFLGRPVLCRIRERDLVFIPPISTCSSSGNNVLEMESSVNMLSGLTIDPSSLSETVRPYYLAFREAQSRYPWLLSFLNQCNIPIYDPAFLDCAGPFDCLPSAGLSLGRVIASKLVVAKRAGYFSELTSFPASDCEELFNLFVSDFLINRSNYGREELDALRELPIYKTVVGLYTQLHGNDLCVIASNSFLKPYDEHCLSYTMESDESLLLRALGVPELHDQQILVRFALPEFEGKSQSQQEDILIYIYMNWQELQIESSVVDALKETHFVRNADEFSLELSKPRDLFDPNDALLTSVFSGERKRFPGERFTTDGWLQILRKLGLRSATEADVMLECARRVEFLGSECVEQNQDLGEFDGNPGNSHNELSSEIWSLAESLVEAVFSNFAVLYSNNFCNAFGKIACVPSERGFPNVGGKRGGKRVLSSYSEAILLKDWPLAWSCAPILLRPNVVPPEYSWGALNLKSPPSFSTVLKHLQIVGKDGGGDALAHWPTTTSMMTVEDAACEILKYLSKVWDSLSSTDVQELEKVAFLPAANGTRLVKASSLFVRLGVNLSPFVFELPSTYLPFVRILKNMGLQETLSVSSAKDLLLNLQKACGYQRLNPNELRAVMEILHFICDETEDFKSERSGWHFDAVVPDDGSRLVHARSCVYIDSCGSRFVKFINSSRLRFVHLSVPERTCLTLGIRKLSDVVEEELNVEVHTLGSIGPVSLEFMRQKLLSRSFQDAVFKILSSFKSNIPSFNTLSPEQVNCLLEDAADKIQFVQSIYTRFLLLPDCIDITYVPKDSTLPEWAAEVEHRAFYYIHKGKNLYLVAEPPNYISVVDVISIVLSDILGSPSPLPLGSLFLCPENSESALTDVLRICFEDKGSVTMKNNSDLIGKAILAQDARQVQFHPLRPFYMGEIVAWRSQNGEKLKYGKVPEDVRPSAGQALYRFGVEIAPGVIDSLLSSQVFSFRSVSLDEEGSSVVPDISDMVSQNTLHMPTPEDARRDNIASTQTGKDLRYGRVSPAELVQAVHEMLSAAGVNIDMETQTLLRTNLTLQERLKDSEAAFLLEQDKADTAAREADTAKAAWQCRICLSAEVDVTLVPCGHVLCRRCSSAVSKCPFCRLQVSKTLRIFRP